MRLSGLRLPRRTLSGKGGAGYSRCTPRARDPVGLQQRHRGIGLGLAISEQMAKGMGAGLWVESEIGSGSTFTLALSRERD